MSNSELRGKFQGLLVLILVSIAGVAASNSALADAVSAQVARDGKRFAIDFSVEVDAPAARVLALLTDYPNLATISPSTTYSGWIEENVLRVEIRACVMVFCKTMTKLTRVSASRDGTVQYDGVRTAATFKSSFAYSSERLSVQPVEHGEGSVVTYNADLEAAFNVPAVIRGWMVRYVLVRDLKATLTNVEALVAVETAQMKVGEITGEDASP